MGDFTTNTDNDIERRIETLLNDAEQLDKNRPSIYKQEHETKIKDKVNIANSYINYLTYRNKKI